LSILFVDDVDDLMPISDSGKLIRRSASSISMITHNTQGIKLVGSMPEKRVVGVARLVEKTDLS
jgi:DNA gyrase subunit A